MKWFKHYTNASLSHKLNLLRDKYGLEGYARYWLLVELLAEKFDGENTTFEIHPRTLSQQLGYYRHTMTKQWLNYGQTLGLYRADCSGDVWVIVFDKLLEIKDNHTNNLQAKSKALSPREDKEKIKKRIDKIKGSDANSYSPDDLIQLWNETLGDKLSYCRGLGSGKHIEKFSETRTFIKDLSEWVDIFEKCKSSPNLMGENGIEWKVNLLWLVDYDNLLKVLNGNYDQGSSKLDVWAKEWVNK